MPAGLNGSLHSPIHPEWKTIEAVKDLAFEMEPGELLGFIGPNRAGQSTTIKILTGILYPTSGSAEVLGFVPWLSTEVYVHRELTFLFALWKANLLAAMEYRASFLTQVIGTILKDGFYFVFWIIFFNRFQQIQGWMFLIN